MPKVSVIVVNYNGKGMTTDCLKSLEAQSFRDFEVLVVDNGSLDSSLKEIKEALEEKPTGPRFKVIPLPNNTGFTGGNAEGLRHSKGEFVALLNNDAKPYPGWLEEMVKAMQAHARVGICASKMITNGGHTIDSAGDGYVTSLKGYKRGEGLDIKNFDKMEYVFGACAGAALYRKKMIEEIGFLDEEFFLIHEDTDMNCRAQLAGWNVLYVPSALVYHKVRSTIKNLSDTAVYYSLRNIELVRLKNMPLSVFLLCLPEVILGTVMEFLYFAVRHRKFRLYLRAKRDALKVTPQMLKKRAVIMQRKKVNAKHLLRYMTTVWHISFLKTKVKKLLYG
jgi:GT2 family glycosyltransferase